MLQIVEFLFELIRNNYLEDRLQSLEKSHSDRSDFFYVQIQINGNLSCFIGQISINLHKSTTGFQPVDLVVLTTG